MEAMFNLTMMHLDTEEDGSSSVLTSADTWPTPLCSMLAGEHYKYLKSSDNSVALTF